MSTSPYGLNPHQVAHIKGLKFSEDFATFTKLLSSIEAGYTDSLLRAKAPHDQSYHQGFVAALRKAQSLVDEITTLSDTPDARDTRRSREAARVAEQRNAALFGTPFWNSSP